MAKVENFARILIKRSSLTGATATTPPSNDHTLLPAWSPSDIYVGEFFLNEPDQKLWIRTNSDVNNGIKQVLFVGDIPVISGGTGGTGVNDLVNYVQKNDLYNENISPNLFDPSQITPDSIISETDGTIVTAVWTAGYVVTGFIPISSLTQAISNKNFTWIVFFDSNKTYISGIVLGGQRAISTPNGTAFFRFSFPNIPSVLDTLQVNVGTVELPYQPFGTTITAKFKTNDDLDNSHTSIDENKVAGAKEVTELYKTINPTYNTITVRRYSGGDFNGNNAIQYAIDSITDASATNQYIIDAKGIFVAYLPEHYTKSFSVLYSFILLKPYVHLISKNKNDCIIQCTLATNLGTGFSYGSYQNINHNVNNSKIEGVTFIASNIRYAVHIDGLNTDFNISFKNCTIWNQGNTGDALVAWASPSPFGIGMTSGMNLLIEDCEVKGIDYALYAHSNNTFIKPSEIKFNRCKITTTNSSNNVIMYAQPLGSGCMDRFIVENCQVDSGGIDYRSNPWCPEELVNQRADHAEFELILPSMTPRAFDNSALSGYGLRIKSKSTGPGSVVSFDIPSPAFELIIGDPQIAVEYINRYGRKQVYGFQFKNGINGLSGYAIGTLDIGMYKVGSSVDKYIGALGKRLGDCSTDNKTLTVIVDWVSYNIVFNKNYNGTANTVLPSYTNTQIIAEIVAVIGAVATVDEYVVGRDYYPQFDGVLNMVNADASEVLCGMGIVFTGVKTFKKALNSDGKIDGICLDDGGVGDECRVIHNGEIWAQITGQRFAIKETTSITHNIGATLGISSTANGIFDSAATPSVIIASRTNVLTFIK